MIRHNLSILLLLLLPLVAFEGAAQNRFQYVSQLSTTTEDGLYRIRLNPKICGLSGPSFSDLRLLTEGQKQVPYILQLNETSLTSNFVPFPILSAGRGADQQTHIIILNPTTRAVSELSLITRNAQANRTISLSGSRDQKSWFVIKENILLAPVSEERDSSTNIISFPPTNYRFLQVTVLGKNILPIDIFEVGNRRKQNFSTSYFTLPTPTIRQQEVKKQSIINVYFDHPYLVDGLTVKVEGPELYNRSITIIADTLRQGQETILSSTRVNSFSLNVKTAFIRIIIENGDSPPLQVSKIMARSRIRSLVAFLKKDDRTRLYFGDSNLISPDYDLSFFRDSIQPSKTINTSSPQLLTVSIVATAKPVFPAWALWIVLAVALVVLVLFTRKMMAEVSSRNVGDKLES